MRIVWLGQLQILMLNDRPEYAIAPCVHRLIKSFYKRWRREQLFCWKRYPSALINRVA
jgi:hypothetical protein